MKRGRLLVLAGLLLAAAALLLSLGEREPAPVRRKEPAFPTRMSSEDWQRLEARRTLDLPAPPPAPDPDAASGLESSLSPAPAPAPERRDPFLVALPVQPGDPVLVLEANALRHSRLGELFVGCLLSRDPRTFSELERETGIDVLKDVDRVALVGETVVASGFFDRARWPELARDATVERYGEGGRIYTRTSGRDVLGVWRDQLVVVGTDGDAVRRALDQLEGRAPVPASAIPEELAYGEVYGVVPGSAARKLLPGADRELADRIAAAASRIELHVDAMQDVAAVVRVRGDPGALDDLARSVGAALAVARLEAQAVDDRQAADLLEFARVRPGGDGFAIDLALPADRLEAWFGGCGRRAAALDDDESVQPEGR
jgi:hypothetical protein